MVSVISCASSQPSGQWDAFWSIGQPTCRALGQVVLLLRRPAYWLSYGPESKQRTARRVFFPYVHLHYPSLQGSPALENPEHGLLGETTIGAI